VSSNTRCYVSSRAAIDSLNYCLFRCPCGGKVEVIHLLKSSTALAMNHCIGDVSMNTGHMPLQAIRALEFDRKKRASKENEAHIQARLQTIRRRRKELKERSQEWDRVQAEKLTGISRRVSKSFQLPRVLEEATNTLQQSRAERVNLQVRVVALEEELRIVKTQQSEAENARVVTAGELEILKVLAVHTSMRC
jgi:hypothetical protein